MGLASLDLSDNSACSKMNFVLINSFINIVLILVTVVRNFLLLLLPKLADTHKGKSLTCTTAEEFLKIRAGGENQRFLSELK